MFTARQQRGLTINILEVPRTCMYNIAPLVAINKRLVNRLGNIDLGLRDHTRTKATMSSSTGTSNRCL